MLQAASLAQELPSSMLPADPALTPADHPSAALPFKAPAPPMNTHPGALTTNGHPSMALPSKAAVTDLPAAAGLGLSEVPSVDQRHKEIKSPSNAPSVFSPSTKSLSKLPRRVRDAARVESTSTEKAEATAGKAELLAAKRRQPSSPKAQPSSSRRPSVPAATAGTLKADSPADLSKSTSPIKGLVNTGTSQPIGPSIYEEPLAKLPSLGPLTPSDEAFAKGTTAVSPDGFTFFNKTAIVAPHAPKYSMNATKDAVFRGFPKQAAFSQPLPLGFLLPPSSSLLSETEVASEAHSVQPNAAASMPSLPPFGEATAEVGATPSSKKSCKPPRHPRINILMGGRGKGQPLLPPATPIKSPAPVPNGSSVDAVMSEPTTPGPVPASPAAHAEVDPFEQPTPGTPVGSPMNWSPTPLVADAAPLTSPPRLMQRPLTPRPKHQTPPQMLARPLHPLPLSPAL